jgi:hypothetical protein
MVCACLHNAWLHDKVTDAINTASDFNNFYEDTMSTLAETDAFIGGAQADITDLQQQLQNAPQNIQTDLQRIQSVLPTVQHKADSIYNQIQFDASSYLSEAHNDEYIRNASFMGLFAFFGLEGLILLLCMCGRQWRCLGCHTFLLWIFMLLSLIVSAVLFAAMMLASDVCVDPTTFIEYNIQNQALEYFQYYSTCEGTFPLQGDIDEIFVSLYLMNETANNVNNYITQKNLTTSNIALLYQHIDDLFSVA